MTAILTVDYGRFIVHVRERTSSHIPQVEPLTIDRMVEMYAAKEWVWIYRAHPKRLIIVELENTTLGVLQVSATALSWKSFLENHGKDGVYDIYSILRDSIESGMGPKRASAAVTPIRGRILTSTMGSDIPERYLPALEALTTKNMGEIEDLIDVYAQLLADDGVFLFDKDWHPYSVWQTGLSVIVALVGFPYSLYLEDPPYNADFWTQVRMVAPELYKDDAPSFSRMGDIKRALRNSNLALIDLESKKEVADVTTDAVSTTTTTN